MTGKSSEVLSCLNIRCVHTVDISRYFRGIQTMGKGLADLMGCKWKELINLEITGSSLVLSLVKGNGSFEIECHKVYFREDNVVSMT